MAVKLSEGVKEREIEIRAFIEPHAETFGLDPNLVRALITQESRFEAEAVSPTGAYGLGQFTGIGARQVQNIANMRDCPDPEGLHGFTKSDADDPDLGVKGICATLWWLFNKKYHGVVNKKVQLEAVLTFYNSGGKAAALVVKHGGHDRALPHIKQLPVRYRSQADKYAPEVALWYVAWHEYLKPVTVPAPVEPSNPFEGATPGQRIDTRYRTLVECLRLLGEEDGRVDVMINSRDGLTEVTLILPGEFNFHVRN